MICIMSRIIFFLLLLCNTVFAQDLIRGPYLQNLTPESIHILWRTSEPMEGKVWVGATPDNLDLVYFSTTNDINHNIQVNNLKPNTKYYYAIGYENNTLAGKDISHHFTTAPVSGKDSKPVKIWVTGDFGSKNENQIEVRKSFEESIHIDDTDIWLWLGDNAYRSGTDEEYQERVFSKDFGYDSILRFLPFFAVPGNHDYRSVDKKKNPNNHTGPYYDVIDVPTNGQAGGVPSHSKMYYSFNYGDIHFVALNSEAYKPSKLQNTFMISWLKNNLSNINKKWLIVFFHQPPYSKGSHNSDRRFNKRMKSMREVVNPILEEHGADLVLSGHSHVYERSYLIKGHYSTSKSFDRGVHVIQNKSGYYDRQEHYTKSMEGKNSNEGTIYVVVGNSGRSTFNPSFGHPVFYYEEGGLGVCGSLVIDIDGDRLDATYLKKDGSVGEVFTIIKSGGSK
jgi:acid phosphatase type 7